MSKIDLKGLFNVAKEAATGNLEFVPEEISNERFNICLNCPKLTKPLLQCSECGCFMKVKTKISSQECPLGKWNKYDKETI